MGTTTLRSIGIRAAVAAGALACALIVPAGLADGAEQLEITQAPTLSGTPQVGAPLTAVGAEWTGPDDTVVTWIWMSCRDALSCQVIPGADTTAYTPVAADEGAQLLAWLHLAAGHQEADAQTELSGPVAPAPTATPTPTPTPTPQPTPTASPPAQPTAPAPVPAKPAAPAAAAKPAHRPRMLRPRPTVRIRGWLIPGGAHLSMLSVRAPRRVRISARCRGAGCPRRSVARRARAVTTRLHAFERDLRAGTRLDIRITKRGFVGKRTVILIRRGRIPRRLDTCLAPGSRSRAVACTRAVR